MSLDEFVRCTTPGLRFSILLEKVLYDGTHTGDWISGKIAEKLLKDVDTVPHSIGILADSEKEFFNNLKLLCEALVATGNPVVF
jgi:hypothetical protein